jgi:hypothetical protein
MPYRRYGVKRHNREQGAWQREGLVLRARSTTFVFKVAGAIQPMAAMADARGPLTSPKISSLTGTATWLDPSRIGRTAEIADQHLT